MTGLPWWSSGKESACNAGDMSSIPGAGRSHMLQGSYAPGPQLRSLHSRARELQLHSPRAATAEATCPRAGAPQQEKPPQGKAQAPPQRVALTRCN